MTAESETKAKQKDLGNENSKVIKKLMFVVIGMFGFGFALVPIYDVFCDITGLNGKTKGQQTFSQQMKVDESREVNVEFVASLNKEMPWSFEPKVKFIKVNPGKPTRIEYVAKNKTNRDIIGQAVPSVAPGQGAPYFQKTECFCFTEQLLKAGEEKQMPVVFVIDPELPEHIKTLTLSYTFFIKPGSETKSKDESVALN